jgi:hypothetical protein
MNIHIFDFRPLAIRELHLNLLLRLQVNVNQRIQLSMLRHQLLVHRRSLRLRPLVEMTNERSLSVFTLLEPNPPASIQNFHMRQSRNDKLPPFMLRRIALAPQRPILNAQVLQRGEFAQSVDVSP